jgi:hypothetical protein
VSDEVNNEMTVLEDTALVAFLSLQGHRVVPIRSKEPTPEEPQVRIAFEVYGSINADIEAYHNNAMIGISEYVRHLKQVRSSMFNLKAIGKKKGG